MLVVMIMKMVIMVMMAMILVVVMLVMMMVVLRMIMVTVVIQWLSCVRLFEALWTAACQASLSFTISQSLLTLMSIESVMASNHLTLSHPLLLLPSIFPSIRVFSKESALLIKWPK